MILPRLGLFPFLLVVALCSDLVQLRAQNLLVNGSFENGGGGSAHGTFTPPGWTVNYYGYHYAGVYGGDASAGTQELNMDSGGYAQTASDSLVSITHPGGLYRLRFDLKTYYQANPANFFGSYGEVYFYDSAGNVVRWESTNKVQDRGTYNYQTIELYAVAPANAVTARVAYSADRGSYGSTQDTRNSEVDNFRFEYIPEDKDRLSIRQVPLLAVPGKTCNLDIRYAATSSKTLSVILINGSNTYGSASTTVTAGRGLVSLSYAVPSSLPNAANYAWKILLGSTQMTSANVTVNQASAGAGTISADNANIVLTGRCDTSDPKNPILYWYGSRILTRFQGTSVVLRGSSPGNGYGGTVPCNFNVVIDGGTPITTTLNGYNQSVLLATGLSSGVHTLEIMKSDESASSSFTFQGLVLDSGSGLLKPGGFSRQLDVYGDSVTSGGTADPTYYGYAPTLGRAMGSDVHIISKGGTGVAASFSGLVTLSDYWNLLDFTNGFSTAGARVWNFASYQPRAVVMAIGHNDQFNNGPATFTAKYDALLANLEQVYPGVQIFCTVPLISDPDGLMAPALEPLLPTDSHIHYRRQRQTWTDPNTSHPPTAAHQAMVYGDNYHWSMAEWIEETMGWGLGLPPDTSSPIGSGPSGFSYVANENATYNFTQPVDIAYGSYGSFTYLYGVTGTFTFNTSTFGDPNPSLVKSAYVRAASSPIESTPTMSEWGLMVMSVLLVGAAVRRLPARITA